MDPIQQHLLLQVRPHHTWPEVHQMVDNFFANSYAHLPGQTIGNIDQDVNYIKGKAKKGHRKRQRKVQGKGKNNTQQGLQQQQQLLLLLLATTTTTAATTTNNINLNRKEKAKEKVPSGATTTTTTRARTSRRVTRTTTKEKGSLHRRRPSTKCWICGKLRHRAASCWFNSQKNVNNIQQQQQLPPQHQQFQLQGTSDQPISYHCLQLPTTTSTTTTTSDTVSSGTTSTTFHGICIIYDQSVHTRTCHLRHHFHQQ